MIRIALLTLGIFTLSTGVALAEGDASAGKEPAKQLCSSCHGLDGNGQPANPEWPAIAGQHAGYAADQLKAIQQGQLRSNLLMAALIGEMSERTFEDLAAYYETLPRRTRFADENEKQAIARGETLYRAGSKEKGIAACMGCHGPNGAGNGPAGFPALASQTAAYTAKQLRMFKSGERANDPQMMMRDTAARLSEEEIDDLAKYLAGLH